ncbi:hypothetical protein WJX72_011582 [[Myrmecia] bisecta]|uniref:Fe2OG dioxygenase domain-containing protein n=1 Tax=[Myrmecia] bisecta TaxID=41462 RepID=A0AAW1RA12_9CHLO
MVAALPLPVIDLSRDEKEVVTALRSACLDHGFFCVSKHGISQEVIMQQFEESKKFYALDLETKMKYESDHNNIGFTPMGEQTLDPPNQTTGDTKESCYLRWPEVPADSELAKLPFMGPNKWPDADLPSFRPVFEAYMTALADLSARLTRLLALALHLPDTWFDDKFDHPFLTCRPIHYAEQASNPASGVFGAGAHTDWGFTTLLITDGTPGLQLNYKGEWLDVPPVDDAIVVNLGDLLQRWTNDQFKSTLHRVVTRSSKERYSCAFFVSPNVNALVECLPTCLKPGETPKHKPITCAAYQHGKYLETHSGYAALGATAPSTPACEEEAPL